MRRLRLRPPPSPEWRPWGISNLPSPPLPDGWFPTLATELGCEESELQPWAGILAEVRQDYRAPKAARKWAHVRLKRLDDLEQSLEKTEKALLAVLFDGKPADLILPDGNRRRLARLADLTRWLKDEPRTAPLKLLTGGLNFFFVVVRQGDERAGRDFEGITNLQRAVAHTRSLAPEREVLSLERHRPQGGEFDSLVLYLGLFYEAATGKKVPRYKPTAPKPYAKRDPPGAFQRFATKFIELTTGETISASALFDAIRRTEAGRALVTQTVERDAKRRAQLLAQRRALLTVLARKCS